MSHCDDEQLADLALGSLDEAAASVRAHVDICPVCAATVEELRRTVALASTAERDPTWIEPHPRVWSRIEDAIARDAIGATGIGATSPRADPTEPASPAPVTSPGSPSARRQAVSWAWAAGMAAASLAIGVLAGRTLWSDTPPTPTTIAQTQLDTLDTKRNLGEATVVREDNSVDLKVDVSTPLDARDGFLEVWLINSDGKRMVSVGVLRDGAPATFQISQALIDEGYVIVDISREGFDDKPQHSGDSLARGTLPT